MQNLCNARDLALEHAQRRGIGQHQRGGVFVHLPLQRLQVNAALGVRLQILHLVATDGRRRRVGAVRGVRDDHLLARVALRLVPRTNQQNAGELAMCTRSRLQRDCVHAGDLDQTLLQQVDHFERALR